MKHVLATAALLLLVPGCVRRIQDVRVADPTTREPLVASLAPTPAAPAPSATSSRADLREPAARYRIYWGFIQSVEGRARSRGYVPSSKRTGKPLGRSGVTVGTGFDLGQHDAADLRRLGLDRRLIAVLQPYLRRQGNSAAVLLKKRPLELSTGEVTALDRAKRLDTARKIEPTGSDPPAAVAFAGGFSRNLWTVLPTNPADINGHLTGNGKERITSLSNAGIDVPNAGGEINKVPIGEFSKTVSPEYFFGVGSVDTAQRDTIVDWVHGVAGSGREDERFGDIYHSTPAIVGPLVDDLEDRSYNDWRLGFAHQQSPDPLEDLSADGWALNRRPRVIYASTNDGIIHAFLADDYPAGEFTAGNNLDEFACAGNKDAGTELWGFIPPMFLDDLDDLLSGGSKQWFADGSIMVRDLYDVRAFAEDDGGGGTTDSPAGQTNVWRTVLFLSFRNGGNGIVALDVTNPCKPEFLWQFTDSNLGDTYGQPTAAQIFLEDDDPTPRGNSGGPIVFKPRQSHGVIIVPGGQGVGGAGSCMIASGPALPEGMDTATATNITPRPDRRCWRGTLSVPPATQHGRALYFIDLATGSVIRKLDEDTFPAPLNGAVSVFRGDTGTVGSAAYTVDADGVLWRIDMSSADPEDWEAEALHDLYYAGAFDDAEPTYYPPALTINPAGEVVILVGTGNIDVLDDATAVNRVVSITEKLTFSADGFVSDLEGRLNWEIELDVGEQMTGPVELFGGQVFFGSFQAGGGTAIDACPFGGSRIFGVHYLDDPLSAGDLVPLLEDILGNPSTVLDSTDIPELENALLVGLQVAQRPVCTTTQSVNITDPFDGTVSTLAMPSATSGREFRLMAHLSGSASTSGGLSINIPMSSSPTLGSLGASPSSRAWRIRWNDRRGGNSALARGSVHRSSSWLSC